MGILWQLFSNVTFMVRQTMTEVNANAWPGTQSHQMSSTIDDRPSFETALLSFHDYSVCEWILRIRPHWHRNMIRPEFLFLLLEIQYIPSPSMEFSLIGGTIKSWQWLKKAEYSDRSDFWTGSFRKQKLELSNDTVLHSINRPGLK